LTEPSKGPSAGSWFGTGHLAYLSSFGRTAVSSRFPLGASCCRMTNLDPGRRLESWCHFRCHFALGGPGVPFSLSLCGAHEAALERSDPSDVWRERIAPFLNTPMGGRLPANRQGSLSSPPTEARPLVAEWARREGKDPAGEQIEIDFACELADGRVMTGAVKWNSLPRGAAVHERHLDTLQRLAESGVKWAHWARDRSSPLVYVSAAGFTSDIETAARPVVTSSCCGRSRTSTGVPRDSGQVATAAAGGHGQWSNCPAFARAREGPGLRSRRTLQYYPS